MSAERTARATVVTANGSETALTTATLAARLSRAQLLADVGHHGADA